MVVLVRNRSCANSYQSATEIATVLITTSLVQRGLARYRQGIAGLGVALIAMSLGVLNASDTRATVTVSQLGNDVEGQRGSYFGSAVAISGDGTKVTVGSQSGGLNTVRVFNWNGSGWQQLGSDINGKAGFVGFGWSVATSQNGNRVVAGAIYNDGVNPNTGFVRVLHWNGSTWQQLGSDIDGKAANEQSGSAVAMSADGNRIVIGAQGKGLVRVYQWNGDETKWDQLGDDINGPSVNGRFGFEVDISDDGTTIAVMDYPSSGQGAALVFDWTGSAWQQRGSNIADHGSGILKGDVSLSGDGSRLAVGSPSQDIVEVFQWADNTWVKVGTNIVGSQDDGYFGFKIELSQSGSRLAVGGPWNTDSSGRVRVFDWETDSWNDVITPINGAVDSESGHGIGISQDGSRVAVGAPRLDNSTGQLRVFQLVSPEPEPDPEPEPPANDNENAVAAPTSTVATSVGISVAETQSATSNRQQDLPATGSSTHTLFWLYVLATGVALTVISRRQKLPPC